MENFVITIARGFGTGGRQIAAKLADELHIHSYENRILTLASQYSGYDEHLFEEENERLKGNLLMNQLASLPKRKTIHPNTSQFVSNEKLFEYQKKIIEGLADTTSCVIVGKCADDILKDRKNVVSVYIEAPRAYCLQRVMQRMQISEDEANQLITKTDRYRADYYKFYTHGNYWTNPVNYDITLNSARIDEEGCVQLVLHCLKLKMGEEWFAQYMASFH
ncbi:MAG: cytidylate kinase-like family protein [Pygmaiobacter sp.]|nr:cytidylate kinase-like family protein [Pygmaiobacter sp.]